MYSLTDLVKFNKSQQSYHARQAQQKAESSPSSAEKHKKTSLKHAATVKALETQLKAESSNGLEDDPNSDLFSLNPLNIEDLPEDLSEELTISQSDTEDAQVLELLRIAGRSLDLNELLIGCYRKYKVTHKRNQLTARLYRLVKRKLVHNVGKGKYALGPAPKEDSETESNCE